LTLSVTQNIGPTALKVSYISGRELSVRTLALELITLIHHLIIFVAVLFKVAVFNWSLLINDITDWFDDKVNGSLNHMQMM